MNKIAVYSEIGKLKTVLLHEPGLELTNLVPDYLEDFLPYWAGLSDLKPSI